MPHLIRIGARKSTLAKIQAYTVGLELQRAHSDIEIQYYFQESAGDKDLTSPLWKIEGKGVFTRDLQESLLNNKIDLIVHSWKDLDLESRSNTTVSSVCKREDQRDVFLIKRQILYESFRNQIKELVVCTSSPRREYNLSEFLPQYLPYPLQTWKVLFEPIRGNIQTRLKKFISDKNYSGLVMAKAGIDRLLKFPSLLQSINENYISQIPTEDIKEFKNVAEDIRDYLNNCEWMIIPISENPNAPAQGSLAVEYLTANTLVRDVILPLVDPITSNTSIRERMILGQYGGGCHQKIGVSVITRDWGDLVVTKGFTDSGVILNTKEVENKNSLLNDKFSRDQIWPPSGKMVERTRQNTSLTTSEFQSKVAEKDLFLTRTGCLDDEKIEFLKLDARGRVLWTAGTSTWKFLAKKGLWIHGSSDSLGERDLISISTLLNRNPNFLKITHTGTREETSPYPVLFTYESYYTPPKLTKEEIRNIKICFWRSGSEFDNTIETYPELKDCIHCCGLGSTFDHLIQNGITPIPYYGFKEWIERIELSSWQNNSTKDIE